MTTAITKAARPNWAEGLTDREQAFVEAYVSTLNATEAAERCGFGNTRKSRRETGHRYQHRPNVAEVIAKLIEQRTGATKSRVLEEVSKLAFSKINDVLEVKDGALIVKNHASLDDDVLSTIAAVEEHINDKGYRTLRVKQHDRLAALSLLAKILGMNTSKVEVSGPGGRPVRLDVDASSARARIESRLDAIASRQATALPAPSERPIRLERVGDVYSVVPARTYPTVGERD
jgi:phage terminase small subunit